MKEPSSTFKSRLNEAMDIRNIKPVELSEKCGISKSAVSHYMSGYAEPKSNRLYIIAQALDVNEAWLMGYDVPMESYLSSKKSADNNSLKALSNYINSHPDSIGYLAILCKNERIEREYTEKAIAQKCNITLKEYLDFENSYKNIGITKIGSIVSFFDFNVPFVLGYLVGATGNRNEIVDIMVSQASEEDKDIMKYIASEMVKMNSEELNFLVEFLKRDLPEHKTNTQKFTKAMYDFHKIQHKEER